jgi:N-acetylglucosaminyl-diphospho-decaprenol L-rhamnosyltransferase
MSAPSPRAVSIVIPSWNTSQLLADLLESIAQTTSRDACETIVVDNGSHDGSADMVAARFPWVRLVRNAENRGYAEGNNQGIALATGRFVLLLGSDTVLQEGTVSTLVDFLDAHPNAGAAACRLLNPDRTPQGSCKRFPTLWDAACTYLSLYALTRSYSMHGFDFHKTQEVDQPAGTCLLIRHALLEEIHGFDERYKILYTDVDLCQRIVARGWKIYYVAETELVHHGSVSTRSAPAAVRLAMYQDILRYFRRHAGAFSLWILTPILFVRLVLRTRSASAFRLFTFDATE